MIMIKTKVNKPKGSRYWKLFVEQNGKYKIAMGENPTEDGEPEYLMSSDSKPKSELFFIININFL